MEMSCSLLEDVTTVTQPSLNSFLTGKKMMSPAQTHSNGVNRDFIGKPFCFSVTKKHVWLYFIHLYRHLYHQKNNSTVYSPHNSLLHPLTPTNIPPLKRGSVSTPPNSYIYKIMLNSLFHYTCQNISQVFQSTITPSFFLNRIYL